MVAETNITLRIKADPSAFTAALDRAQELVLRRFDLWSDWEWEE
jgi:hypothetical protein